MKKIYLPGINGLRGIAAMLVVLNHVTKGLYRFQIVIPRWMDLLFDRHQAIDAVNIFFVISGFLITYLLLKEKEAYGSISIKKFYQRRMLRIWPVYFLYLIVAGFISLVMHDNFIQHYFLYYIFFGGNIPGLLTTAPFYFVHYWSLGVEEQFYLFWPFAFKYLKKKILWLSILLLIILSMPIFTGNNIVNKAAHVFFWCAGEFQGIMIGSLAALVYFKRQKYFSFCFNKACQLIALSMILLLFTDTINVFYFHDALMGFLAVIIVIALIENKSYFLKTENKVLNYLGKISYGLYVWHPIMMWVFLRVFKEKVLVPKEYLIWIICIATPPLSILLADISYRFYEVKFLRMKKKYMLVLSSNTPETTGGF